MKIKKVLNNNAVVVIDGQVEKIVMGSGIAFQKGKNDIVNKAKIEKVFVVKDQGEYEKFQEILSTLPVEHIKIAEEVISYAEGVLMAPLNDHIHVALTDHLSFALERLEKGYEIKNKLLPEIKVLYKMEFEISLWAKKLIKERLNIDIPEDEVGYIALHIHTAKTNRTSVKISLDVTTFIRDVIEIIEEEFNLKIETNTVAYQRLLTHLRFAFQRLQEKEPFHDMDREMLDLIQKNHPKAFSISNKISEFVHNDYGYKLPISEQAYIALHIERLTN